MAGLAAVSAVGLDACLDAQQAGDANFYEMSVIDGRLRDMKKRQLEEIKERQN